MGIIFCFVSVYAVQIVANVTCDPVKEYLLPVAERLRRMADVAFKEEERLRTHPDDADEGTVAEVQYRQGCFGGLVRGDFLIPLSAKGRTKSR